MIERLKDNELRNGLLLSLMLILVTIQPLRAQFTITEDFRGSGNPNIIIGDQAYLTSGIDDPAGAGWLRLTKALESQKGYAYVNKSFPSTLGVLIDFEYTMWRDIADNTYFGADGFTIFLFDAVYGPGNFALGAYGGSLGYANSTNNGLGGLTGGYLGIGFDAYGNFVANSEGKNGGSIGISPNSIALRGPTTSTLPGDPNTNRYLGGITLFENGTFDDAINMNGNANDDVIDYNTTASTRPSQTTFYRRVQVEIEPTSDGKFEITVRWAKAYGEAFTDLITYVTEDVPPSLLKLGFAASTGGGYNNHEIRNILVSTPGNLRVYKLASKDIMRSVPGGGTENEVSFNLEVTNDTDSELSTIDVSDQFTDGDGNPIPDGMFVITNITTEGFIPGTVNIHSSPPISNGSFTGSVGLPANSTGTIIVTGFLDGQVPSGNVLNNTVTVSNNDITDQDEENNTSTIGVPVLAEEVDMVIEKKLEEYCLNTTTGNAITILVRNMGTLDANYNNTSTITVTETIPAGGTLSMSPNSDWSLSSSGDTYTFTKTGTGTLSSGMTLPSIVYTIQNSTSFDSASQVQFINQTSNESIEPIENRNNNIKVVSITSRPSVPVLTNSTVYYCQGDSASPLKDYVEADTGNTLVWYLNEGGTSSSTAPVPSTTTPGSTIYYVSQSNKYCESEVQEIEVVVLENPGPGSITGGGEICANSVPGIITNSSSGTGFGVLDYKWEYSEDNGITWTEISGASEKSYQPEALSTTTQFRRITTADSSTVICESEPSNYVTFTIKNCTVISNPMLPSKAK